METLGIWLRSLETFAERGHGLKPDAGAPLDANYGTSATSENQTLKYIAQRVAVFAQARFKNKLQLRTTKKFNECENYRHGCRTQDMQDFYADCDNTCE